MSITPEFMANYAKENSIPLIPEYSGYKVGDKVTVINGYGYKIEGLSILAIRATPREYGGRFYVYDDAYWFPVPADRIKPA